MISNQAFYLWPQLAWPEEVQPDIGFSPTAKYLFFDVLQTETHLFPLYLLRVASIIAEKKASSYHVFAWLSFTYFLWDKPFLATPQMRYPTPYVGFATCREANIMAKAWEKSLRS